MLAIRPRPERTLKLSRRLPKAKAVTIGVGFLCPDGVVLCADDQITWPSSHKYSEQKIYPLFDKPECLVAGTFSGNPELMKAFKGKFRDSMSLMPRPYTASKIQDTIETVLSFFEILRTEPMDLNLLCGIVIPPNEVRLVKTQGWTAREVDRFDYVGVGDSSVLRFLAPLLVRGRNFLTKDAYYVAAYMVLQAKRYVDGCGGNTDVLTMYKSGKGMNIHLDHRSGVEQRLLAMEHSLGDVAGEFFESRRSREDLEQTLTMFSGQLQSMKPMF